MFPDLRHRAQRALNRLRRRMSPDETRRALRDAVGIGADILFVHSGLSGIGYFTTGPEDVVSVLREFAGTLAMPTHTYCYPTAPGEPGPVFNPASTPSQNGLLTEAFRKQPGVSRSINATHSIAAVGPRLKALVAGHELLDAPCGRGSPYDRLVEKQAAVLLLGVDFHSYTPLHTAEDAADSPFAYEHSTIDRLRYLNADGHIQERLSRRQSRTPRRFREAGDLLQRAGLVRVVGLGRGRILFVPDCAKVHDFLVERWSKTPDFLHRICRVPLQ